MKALARKLAFLLLGIALFWSASRPHNEAKAALYWYEGVHDGPEITVCFAGNAAGVRPQRVREIVRDIRNFEQVANIRFMTVSGTRASDEIEPGGNLNALACPAPTWQGNVQVFAGDIRVALWHTNVPVDPPGMVPGEGCTQARESSSWANPPGELEAKRSCQYNLKLGDNMENLRTGVDNDSPWLNHTLHEFGHALGLSHEHARKDENAGCVDPDHEDYHRTDAGYMTPYDKNSVMHYQFPLAVTPTCQQTGSNYSDSGFTAFDRLALQILYPEDVRVAAFVGTTVLRVGETLNLQAAWRVRGANMNVVANNYIWRINGVPRSTTPVLAYEPPGAGQYTLEFSYVDLLGRDYYYSGVVRVLEPEAFDAQIVAPIMTTLPMLYPNYVYIPNIDATIQPDEHMTFLLPAGIFTDTVVIDYSAQPAIEAQGKHDVGIFYELDATYLSNGQPAALVPGTTYHVQADYEEGELDPRIHEADLGFYAWDPHQNPGPPSWEREPSSMVDANANRVTAAPDHFSLWAVLDKNRAYLPAFSR